MNKLIIAGNGFDLAHGLPTSYNHFMDAFWRDLGGNYKDEFIREIINLDKGFFFERLLYYKINNYNDFKELIDRYFKETTSTHGNDGVKGYKFINNFFKELNEIHSIQNWVDVENEYYQALKNICKDEKLESRQKREKVLNLHKEFEEVKKLLERYLHKNVVKIFDLNSDHGNLRTTFQKNRRKLSSILQPSGNIVSKSTFVLNFNYTPSFDYYERELTLLYKLDVKINHIHGKLNENTVFGFGDEMDDDYKLIEDMDDNEYLRYFKSFQYVQNSNYKNVLRYIDSEKFQVVIIGHSCGLSDRTLLNTIFEHKNCRSIKVFYHQKKDGTDNYTEVIQNISRHFNDKKLMRTKIVEKTLCEPMPQIQLPKKG